MGGKKETERRSGARPKPVILAVEDDDMCRDLLRKMLGDADYTVFYACDGLEGMRCLEQAGTIDVILLDGNMPRIERIADARRT
ncbi:MAG: response regulator [Polyangiaceae bacterium]